MKKLLIVALLATAGFSETAMCGMYMDRLTKNIKKLDLSMRHDQSQFQVCAHYQIVKSNVIDLIGECENDYGMDMFFEETKPIDNMCKELYN